MAARKPVTFGGVTYPSLREAERQGAGALSTLRRREGLITAERPENRPRYREVRRRQEQARRAVTSGKASPLKGTAAQSNKARTLFWEMPRVGKPPRRVSLTPAALVQIDVRVALGDIAHASLSFLHYYLSPTEKDRNGNPRWRVRRDVVLLPIDLLRAVPLSVRAATGLYPFSDPEHQLHEPPPRLPSGARHPKHRDDGGLLSVTLTPTRHTSL